MIVLFWLFSLLLLLSSLLQSMEITSYHGLVESTSIHCDDRGIHTLFTDLVGGLKGTCT